MVQLVSRQWWLGFQPINLMVVGSLGPRVLPNSIQLDGSCIMLERTAALPDLKTLPRPSRDQRSRYMEGRTCQGTDVVFIKPTLVILPSGLLKVHGHPAGPEARKTTRNISEPARPFASNKHLQIPQNKHRRRRVFQAQLPRTSEYQRVGRFQLKKPPRVAECAWRPRMRGSAVLIAEAGVCAAQLLQKASSILCIDSP